LIDEEFFNLPEEVTRQIGVLPSETWHKGESRPVTNILHKDSGWELKSGLPLDAPLIDHINFLLSVVRPVREQFISLTDKYYSILTCAIYFGDESPEIHFDNELLKQIADLNLRLDLDLYATE
jgi:hypothetical protein